MLLIVLGLLKLVVNFELIVMVESEYWSCIEEKRSWKKWAFLLKEVALCLQTLTNCRQYE